MKVVYLVVSSDFEYEYRIVGIYSSKAKAERCLQVKNSSLLAKSGDITYRIETKEVLIKK